MQFNTKGLVRWLIIATIVGLLNAAISYYLINPLTWKADETALNTLGGKVNTLFALVYGFLLIETGSEWKAARDAKRLNQKEQFLIEAKKRMPASFWLAVVFVSACVVITFHLFHYDALFILIGTQMMIGMIISLLLQILQDLDDPITGVINIEDIPEEWMRELN